MQFVKSGIAVALLVSACSTAPSGGVQPLLTNTSLAPAMGPAVTGSNSASRSGQSLTRVENLSGRQPQPRTDAQVAFMKAHLAALQPRSIAEDREYCGYLGIMPNGELAVTPAKRGQPAGCTPPQPPANMRVIASYHTHAAYAPRYDSEVPSATDLEGDIREGINGYVSTPGGRLWFTDGAAQKTYQLCGVGCLPMDPRFQPELRHPVAQSYTLAALRQRQG